jgi:phosphatidylserine/phosphatidylglycerophosphate/cardiolipin synthase-like enzyme
VQKVRGPFAEALAMKHVIAGLCALGLGAGLGFVAGAHPWREEATAPPDAAAEVHYSPAENLEAIDVREIGRARSTIDVAAYVLTDDAVAIALREAGARGVRVRIWRDPGQARQTATAYDFSTEIEGSKNVEAKVKGPGPIMHLKGYCIDGRELRTGSANFSRSGLTAQDNDLVILRGPHVCDGFEAKFEKAWGG